MTLSFLASITLTSATGATRDGCIDELNQRVCLVESTGPTFRMFNLATQTQYLSNITCVAGAVGVAILTTASAIVVSSSSATVDFIQLSSGYRQNVSGGSTTGITKNQTVAADINTGIALQVTGTARQLVKITSAPSVSLLTNLAFPATAVPISIILKPGGGSWLVGFNDGRIIEIDASGNVLDTMLIPIQNSSGILTVSGTTPAKPSVFNISMSENIICASTDVGLMSFDYSTKTPLTVFCPGNGTSVSNLTICAAASGEILAALAYATNNNKPIYEVDLTIAPYLQVRDYLFTDSTTSIPSMGISTTSNYGFAIQQTNTDKLRIFTVTPRGSTTRTVTFNPGGTHVPRTRLMIVDDTGGVGTTQLIADTIIKSPTTIRVPTGKNLIEYVKMGDGPTAKFDVSRYST